MSKRACIVSNVALLFWFFLDMIGLEIGGQVLVSRAYKEDGIFFIIFLVLFVWFLINERKSKVVLTGWLLMWLLTQFLSHWTFTFFGPHQGKIDYFQGTIKLFQSSNTYIPDLYHIVLHVLILVTLVNMIVYIKKNQNTLI